jgi:hypothetical protein
MRKWLRVVLVAVIVITALQLTTSLVGAQGGTWVSGFTIQNQHPTNTANVTIKFYWAEGTPNAGVLAHTLPDTIEGGKSKTWFTPSIPGLPDGFLGSVVVESSEPVAAIINTQVPTGSGATPGDPNRVGTASGVAEPQLEMYATQVMKGYWGWNSYIAVQNTTADPATVTAYYYDASGTQVLMNTQSLHAYSSYIFRQETEGLPANFNGSAKIVGDKNLAVITNFYNTGADAATAQFHSYNGLGAGATMLYAPRVVKDYYGYQSGLKVQNVGASSTVVTVQYKFGGSTYTQTSPAIGPGQAWGPYMGSPTQVPELALVSGSGSAVITASEPIVATINEDNRTEGRGVTYNAFLDGTATTSMLFPQVTSKYYGYSSGIQMQNVSAQPASCTVVYSMAGRGDVVKPFSFGAGESWQQFLPGVPEILQDFNGSAVVTCDRDIVGIANMSHRSDVDPRYPMNYGDSFITYNGISK